MSPAQLVALQRAYAASTQDRLTQDHLATAKITLFGDLTRAHLRAIATAVAADEPPRVHVQLQAAYEAALAQVVYSASQQVSLWPVHI